MLLRSVLPEFGARALLWLALFAVLGCAPYAAWTPADVTAIDPPPLAGQEVGEVDIAAFGDDTPTPKLDPTIEQLRRDGRAVEALVSSPWVKRFARAADQLPAVTPFTIHDANKGVDRQVDSELFYMTKYGSPLAYARPLDVLATAGMSEPHSLVDFGYGGIGHLRLLASLGSYSLGIDVDPLLRDLYVDAQGRFGRGSVKLLHGAFPSELSAATAGGHDLFISKNVLKRGYIHPAEQVPKKQTIDLGVSDEVFLKAIHDSLTPGGFVLIYNITPAPNGPGLPYRTWADGRCPFDRSLWAQTGFDVLAFDVDDSAAARAQGRALGWDADMDLEQNVFALYTLARRTP